MIPCPLNHGAEPSKLRLRITHEDWTSRSMPFRFWKEDDSTESTSQDDRCA